MYSKRKCSNTVQRNGCAYLTLHFQVECPRCSRIPVELRVIAGIIKVLYLLSTVVRCSVGLKRGMYPLCTRTAGNESACLKTDPLCPGEKLITAVSVANNVETRCATNGLEKLCSRKRDETERKQWQKEFNLFTVKYFWRMDPWSRYRVRGWSFLN